MSTTSTQNAKASKASTLPDDPQQVTQATTLADRSTTSVNTLDATTTKDLSESGELIPRDINRPHSKPQKNTPEAILERGKVAERKFWLTRNDSPRPKSSGSSTKTGKELAK
jgi:hypothetical protein